MRGAFTRPISALRIWVLPGTMILTLSSTRLQLKLTIAVGVDGIAPRIASLAPSGVDSPALAPRRRCSPSGNSLPIFFTLGATWLGRPALRVGKPPARDADRGLVAAMGTRYLETGARTRLRDGTAISPRTELIRAGSRLSCPPGPGLAESWIGARDLSSWAGAAAGPAATIPTLLFRSETKTKPTTAVAASTASTAAVIPSVRRRVWGVDADCVGLAAGDGLARSLHCGPHDVHQRRGRRESSPFAARQAAHAR